MSFTKENARILSVRATTTYAANGSVAAVNAEAVLQHRFINDANSADVRESEKQAIIFNLLDPAIADSPVNGTNGLTYSQLAVRIREATLTRATALGIS